jgi:hypothetical protein
VHAADARARAGGAGYGNQAEVGEALAKLFADGVVRDAPPSPQQGPVLSWDTSDPPDPPDRPLSYHAGLPHSTRSGC